MYLFRERYCYRLALVVPASLMVTGAVRDVFDPLSWITPVPFKSTSVSALVLETAPLTKRSAARLIEYLCRCRSGTEDYGSIDRIWCRRWPPERTIAALPLAVPPSRSAVPSSVKIMPVFELVMSYPEEPVPEK